MADGYTYRNFDLLIDRGTTGYEVRVLASPAGETAAVPFVLPVTDLQLENFTLRLGRPRAGRVRRAGGDESDAARQFGTALFTAAFTGAVRERFTASVQAAGEAGEGLRVRLRLSDTPELGDLPWEFLHDPDNDQFVALSKWTPVVRYLHLPGAAAPLQVGDALGVIVIVADPSDYPSLDVEREWDNVQEELRPLAAAGRVRVQRVAPTLSALLTRLQDGDWHLLHFIGHGGFDTDSQDGVLVFEDEHGRGRRIRGADLGQILHDHRTLRLVVLNSCEGAVAGRTDTFAGAAQSLARQGIPAVVAMQFEITDEAAITFSQTLYDRVAEGWPLDAAVTEGRLAVFAAGHGVEWGTPVLYLRAPDGRIFEVGDRGPDGPALADAPPPSPPTARPPARAEDAASAPPPPASTGDPVSAAPAPVTQPPRASETQEAAPAPRVPAGAGDQPWWRAAWPVVAALLRSAPGIAGVVALLLVGGLLLTMRMTEPDSPPTGQTEPDSPPTGQTEPDSPPTGQTEPTASSTDDRPSEAAVTVDATQPVTDSGLDLERGDRVTIDATGVIRDDVVNFPDRTIDPDGQPDLAGQHPGDPFRGVNHGALVARIGDDVIVVGAARTFQVARAGSLRFAVNDGVLGDNAGAFEVTVTVTRAQPAR